MACCNSSCVVCDSGERNRRDSSTAFWKRIYEGGPDLSLEEKEMHENFKHNQNIYNQIEVLEKKAKELLKKIKPL